MSEAREILSAIVNTLADPCDASDFDNSESKALAATIKDALGICKELSVVLDLAATPAFPDPQTIEVCASVVEDFPETVMAMWDRPGGPPGNGYRAATRKDLAAAIRSIEPVASLVSRPMRATPSAPGVSTPAQRPPE